MSFEYRTGPGAFVRERRQLLVSVMADRREGPLLRVSIAAALADQLGWSVHDRLSPGTGSGDDAGWLELKPAECGPVLRRVRGSRLLWFASALPGLPARYDATPCQYVRPASDSHGLRILLPWWQSLRVAAE